MKYKLDTTDEQKWYFFILKNDMDLPYHFKYTVEMYLQNEHMCLFQADDFDELLKQIKQAIVNDGYCEEYRQVLKASEEGYDLVGIFNSLGDFVLTVKHKFPEMFI